MTTLPSTCPIEPPQPLSEGLISQWCLDPAITFLNHGCFGARPRVVSDAQTNYRLAYEAHPVDWLDRGRRSLINNAKEKLGPFVGMQPQDFGFVTNATNGINTVLRSLTFKPGEELLTTNHVYNAIRQSMKYLAERAGAAYREIDVPFPLHSAQQILDAIDQAITSRTRLLMIDHITSPTAVIFPVREMVELCNQRGVDVLIDGAHAPGMVELDIESLAPAYYSANLHKWVCAPSGAAFLWVRPDMQANIHPTTISHFLGEGIAEEFQWQGTRDITPWLAAKDAIEYFEEFGWDRVREHNHQLAVWVQSYLCNKWGVEPTTPLDGCLIGSMVTLPLPHFELLREAYEPPISLQGVLHDQYQIEVSVVDWRGAWWIRSSCHIYNTADQYRHMAESILDVTAQVQSTARL